MTAFLSFPKDGGPHSGASVGQALAGLVARDTAGMPRVGMLAAPSVDAVAASWKVEVGRFVYVSHTNGAIQFSGLSEAEQVDITPATSIPSGQSRIDRVVWNPVAAQLVYVEGTAAVSPTAPSVGVNAPVARILVQSGDGMVVAARVTADFVETSLGLVRRSAATSSVVHTLPSASSAGKSFGTGLAAVPYRRVLFVSNGDMSANGARFESKTQVLEAGATSANVSWVGGHAGLARLNFAAIPVEP